MLMVGSSPGDTDIISIIPPRDSLSKPEKLKFFVEPGWVRMNKERAVYCSSSFPSSASQRGFFLMFNCGKCNKKFATITF